MAQPLRVLIVDDSPRTRDGLHALLETQPGIELVGDAANGQEAIRLVEELQPGVVLMDLEMPQVGGVEATRVIKQRWPWVGVIVVTSSTRKRAAALAAGADAFLIKGDAPSRLFAALGVGDTPDERRIRCRDPGHRN